MKDVKRKIITIVCAVLAIAIGGIAAAEEIKESRQAKEEKQQEETAEEETAANPDAEVKSGLTKEQEEIQEKIKATYQVDNQQAIADRLEEEKASGEYTASDMLIEYNPFGTNTQSLYVYFETEEPAAISYNVHVSDSDIGDFRRDVWQEEEYTTEHEFQMIGLIPDTDNTITFYITEEDGSTDTKEIVYEMGSLLIILLVYIAMIVVYMQEARYSAMVIATGVSVLAAGIFIGTVMTHSVNKKISSQDLLSCFYDLEVSTANGYHGSSGTVDDFRPYLVEFLQERKETQEDRIVTQKEIEKNVEQSLGEALDETIQTSIDDLFSVKDKIGYEDMELFVSNRKNLSMKIAMCYLFSDQTDKRDFLNEYYFAKVYTYYASGSEANVLERFYLPKFGKVKTRFYCWMHPEWDNGDSGYQNYRARIGVRAGGLFGKEE